MRTPTSTIKTAKSKWNSKSNGGFTLIEMAIVTVIIGMVVAAAAQLLTQRQEWAKKDDTQQVVERAEREIAAFRNTWGRYPCPASLTAGPATIIGTETLYGTESDDGIDATPECTDTIVAVDTGIDAQRGYARVTATDPATGGPLNVMYTNRLTGLPFNGGVPAPAIIRVGAIPYKALNLDEDDAIDGYGNRLIYAVTEHMAYEKTFDPNSAGISILNDQNVSVITDNAGNPGQAHFMIFSTGENGSGGFTKEGGPIPCPATGLDINNCDFATDSVFQIAQTSINDAAGATSTYDDVISYATHEDIPLWEKDPSDTDTNDVAMKLPGNFGISRIVGSSAAEHPSEKVQVDGVIVVRDNPYTTDDPYTTDTIEGQEGKIEAENICDYSSDTKTCFQSNLIAGEIIIDKITGEHKSGGMVCPTGQYMTGIRNGAPICKDEIIVTCPSNSIAIGIKSNGKLKCAAPPLPGCASETTTICNKSKLLPAAPHGTKQKISVSTDPGNPGGTRSQDFKCKNGKWLAQGSEYGSPCDCTTATGGTETVSCAVSSDCGSRFSGTGAVVQQQFQCPSARWTGVEITPGNCKCETTTGPIKKSSCPSNLYNKKGGKIEYRYTHNCTTRQCERKELGNTCGCVPKTEHKSKQCPGGLTGTIDLQRKVTCPDGPNGTYKKGPWENKGGKPDSFFCSCEANKFVDKQDCPTSGHVGDYWVEVDFQCPSAKTVETVVKNTCAPPPEPTCAWKIQGSGNQTSEVPTGKPHNASCGCETDLGKGGLCHRSLGSRYEIGPCLCERTSL